MQPSQFGNLQSPLIVFQKIHLIFLTPLCRKIFAFSLNFQENTISSGLSNTHFFLFVSNPGMSKVDIYLA